jgi:putative two-component system protein, hydrogenase maturation factor HypX/HoxX
VRILLFCSAYNGMTQRVHCELESDGHDVTIEVSADAKAMEKMVENFSPDLIICPFLKHRVPESIWKNNTCLIVHPGIEGDRGPSSLDWAINDNWDYWGVTLLQADSEMDAGDIWATANFPLKKITKASVYRQEVIKTAVQLIKETIANIFSNDFKPRSLNYNNPQVKGSLKPLMAQGVRTINWQEDTTDIILRKIRAADGFPGVLDQLLDKPVYLYGAYAGSHRMDNATPGDLIGQYQGAICRATKDGSLWIKQLKYKNENGPSYKLPATQVLQMHFADSVDFSQLAHIEDASIDDIKVTIKNAVAYVEFNFYNGAMNSEQCVRLLHQIRKLVVNESVRVVAFMGGDDFWSNGIHLNCIEAAENPAHESWRNINAIDDVVKEIMHMTDKVTVAALRNNAGAGGAIMPLACDKVIARDGVVLNPHYKSMGLYGSEYWTYLLPKRVGKKIANQMAQECLPIIAKQAKTVQLVDEVLNENWQSYHQELETYCEKLAKKEQFFAILKNKKHRLAEDEQQKSIESYRIEELRQMKAIFDDPQSEYHLQRKNFVYKVSCGQTPARLQKSFGNKFKKWFSLKK